MIDARPTAARIVLSACLVLITAGVFSMDRDAPLPQAGPDPFDSSFWKHWGDGKGELAAYDLVMPRYGELRKGVAVSIFVTEPFSSSARVKADQGKHSVSDEFQVMKLNLMRDFPTGVYDYNLMTSTFVALQPFAAGSAGDTAKVSFSSQEWCGHVYSQLLFDKNGVREELHSYFDGEADRRSTIPRPPAGMSEDTLMIWARGLAGPFLERGTSVRVPVLRSLVFTRLRHVPLTWQEAELARSSETGNVTVPAGSFQVETRTVNMTDGRLWTFDVEAAAPHRIIRWTCNDGESGQLLGSERMEYWKMNGEAFRDAVKRIGLTPRLPRTP